MKKPIFFVFLHNLRFFYSGINPLITSFIILFIGCNLKSKNFVLDESKINEINTIIESVIVQDSIEIFQEYNESKILCSNLVKLSIEVPNKIMKDRIPPPFKTIYIDNLINISFNGNIFFSKVDSIYILSQDLDSTTISLKIFLNDSVNLKLCSELQMPNEYYQMSIPIFSLDNKRVYVQLDYICGALCGYGKEYFLEKIDGKWEIIGKFNIWLS